MTDTPSYLWAYCERAGDPGLWAEPLNFITNAVFILYGVLMWRWLKTLPAAPWHKRADLWALCISLFLIGLGSGLWHSWAAPGWTVIVDTVPIYIFINIYIFSLYRRLGGWAWWKIGALWAAFTAASTVLQQSLPMETLNGSLMYIPTLLLMFGSGLYLLAAKKEGGMGMVALGGLFLLSLTFRTVDGMLCDLIPIGTHFIWHCLNAVLLYKLVRLLFRDA